MPVRESGIQHPVVALDHIDPFGKGVSPLGDTTAVVRSGSHQSVYDDAACPREGAGNAEWKYRLRGFLHWGYNYYNTYHSLAVSIPIWIPKREARTRPETRFWSIGKDGKPEESIRLMSMHEAMQDAGALQLLESLVGREATRGILDSEGALTLTRTPATAGNSCEYACDQ
jgi:hypothetical protein